MSTVVPRDIPTDTGFLEHRLVHEREDKRSKWESTKGNPETSTPRPRGTGGLIQGLNVLTRVSVVVSFLSLTFQGPKHHQLSWISYIDIYRLPLSVTTVGFFLS